MTDEAEAPGEAGTAGDPEPEGEDDGPDLPPIPDALLAPLLDSAAEALKRLPPAELPLAARRLRSFDRRGLSTPAARHQLRTLLEENEAVLAATAAAFAARPEIGELVEAWSAAMSAGGDAPLLLVREAAANGRLPLLASVLVAALPDGFEFGLGLAVAIAATAEQERESAALSQQAAAGRRAAEEAARRAESARADAEAEVARLEAALREGRRARRARDQEAAGSDARRAELETALADAQGEAAAAARRAAAAEGRASDAERRVGDLERRVVDAEGRAAVAERRAADLEGRAADAEHAERRVAELERLAAAADGLTGPHRAAAAPVVDPDALQRMAAAAEELAAGLRRLAEGPAQPEPPRRSVTRTTTTSAPRRSSPKRRAPVRIPPGMKKDDPKAIEAMMRTPGLAVIVDGYNVSMLAWPNDSVADQRERLCDALAEFQLRFRCEVTVVFDGAEVPGVRPLRRRGLRVVFSPAGQKADGVVIDEVMFRPEDVPVVVVSSDREVRAGAESEGATAISADELLVLMRR